MRKTFDGEFWQDSEVGHLYHHPGGYIREDQRVNYIIMLKRAIIMIRQKYEVLQIYSQY